MAEPAPVGATHTAVGESKIAVATMSRIPRRLRPRDQRTEPAPEDRTSWRTSSSSTTSGVTVADLDAATGVLRRPGSGGGGPHVPGRARSSTTVIGIPDARTEIVVLRPPGGGTGVELARFVQARAHGPGSPDCHGERARPAQHLLRRWRTSAGAVDEPGREGLRTGRRESAGYEDTWLMAQRARPGRESSSR